ncbi:MAG: TM1812 family CRISPR-associated protein [Polyangiales bacterium]
MEERSYRKLVALLGRGNPKDFGEDRYDRVRYVFRDPARISRPTPLVQAALIELVGGYDDVVLIGTEDVRNAWTDARLLALLGCPSRFLVLPSGAGGSDLWKTFEILLPELRDLPSSTGERPIELHVDITHGFRAQSLLVTSALTFAASEWRRQGLEQEPSVFVTYGAYEAREPNQGPDAIAPIWDLGPLLFAAQWNSAIDAFVRHGRADDFEALATRIANERRAGLPPDSDSVAYASADYPRRLGREGRKFADDLACLRLESLQSHSGPALLETLGPDHAATRSRLERDFPPLRETLLHLEKHVALVSTSAPFSRGSVPNYVAVAQLYSQTERYAELAATLREGLAHYAYRAMWHASEAANDADRLAETMGTVDDVFSALSRRAEQRTPNGIEQERLARVLGMQDFARLCALCNQVSQLRNDVLHAGLDQRPLPLPSERGLGARRPGGRAKRKAHAIRADLESMIPSVASMLHRLAEVTSQDSIPGGAS